ILSRDIRWRSRNFRQLLVQGANGSKPEKVSASIVGQASMERLSRKDIRAAGTCVGDLVAVAKIWRKWQAAAPIGGIGNLPTADQEVGGAADVSHVFLTAPNWQFVHGAKDEYVVPAKIIGTVCDSMVS